MKLTSKKCVPCRSSAIPLSAEEAERFLQETPGWVLIDDATKIFKTFRFKDFASAMMLVHKIGDLAEEEGHHPDIAFGWGYCTVVFYTHAIKGLHENDFIMASKVNALSDEAGLCNG